MTDKDDQSPENIFKIMDGIIAQINKTKKVFIIMILTVMVLPPLAFAISHELIVGPFDRGAGPHHGPPPFWSPIHIPFLIALVWLGVGIRQWFILSGWTKKYNKYKKLQEEIDKKLDDDDKTP